MSSDIYDRFAKLELVTHLERTSFNLQRRSPPLTRRQCIDCDLIGSDFGQTSSRLHFFWRESSQNRDFIYQRHRAQTSLTGASGPGSLEAQGYHFGGNQFGLNETECTRAVITSGIITIHQPVQPVVASEARPSSGFTG